MQQNSLTSVEHLSHENNIEPKASQQVNQENVIDFTRDGLEDQIDSLPRDLLTLKIPDSLNTNSITLDIHETNSNIETAPISLDKIIKEESSSLKKETLENVKLLYSIL